MSTLYRIFINGLLTILPITITFYLVAWLVGKLEAAFADPLQRYLPQSFYVPGFGVIVSLLVIFFIGLLVNNFLAARLLAKIESSLKKIPLIKAIYSPLKDIMNLFGGSQQAGLKRVVMVTLSPGVRVLGLVTRDDFSDLGSNVAGANEVAVFIPYSYAVGGFTLVVEKSRLSEVDLGAERAMQLSLTAWIQSRPQV